MRRATERDIAKLNWILSDVFDISKDDGTPESLRYTSGRMVLDDTIWITIPAHGCAIVAKPLNSSTYEVHVASCKECDADLIEVSKKAIKWFFRTNDKAYKLVAFVPENRRDVKLYCIACGYKREGILPKSFIKDNRVMDMVIYGLSREDVSCQ